LGDVFLVFDTKAIADPTLADLQADMPDIAGSVAGRIESKFEQPAIAWLFIIELYYHVNREAMAAEQG
jgi:hypothetical protein